MLIDDSRAYSYPYTGSWPDEKEIPIPGWHGIGNRTWYTSKMSRNCFPAPVVNNIATDWPASAGSATITVGGVNLPDDLLLNVLPIADCKKNNTSNNAIAIFSCPVAGTTTNLDYTLTSAKAENMDLSQVKDQLFSDRPPPPQDDPIVILSVVVAGPGGGTVEGGGIICPSRCFETFATSTPVTLTATPMLGSVFSGWSDTNCPGTGTCIVIMDNNKSVTATFTRMSAPMFTLAVTKTGSGSGTVTSTSTGIDCGATCSASYASSTAVTLIATPDLGSVFVGWSDGCIGTGPCVVIMGVAKEIKATFQPFTPMPTPMFTLAVTKAGLGNVTSAPHGIDCGATCSASFAPGTLVTLTATSTTGSVFVSWSDAGCPGTGLCTVTMNADKSVTATFQPVNASTKRWGTATLFATDNAGAGDAILPQVSFDGSGNAIAVWRQRYSIWANRFTAASSSWGVATPIEMSDTSRAYSPKVAVDASGNAIAVWSQYDGTLSKLSIWANRFTAASNSWDVATLIETDNAEHANYPKIAVDASGNAIVVWVQSDGTRYNIWANRFTVGNSSWGVATPIETDNTLYAYSPKVAVDASGNAIALWHQHDGTRYNIWANRFTAASSSWGVATLFETDNAGDAGAYQVAFDGSGNAIAVWLQYDGTRSNLWANRFTASSNSWGVATLIETNNAGTVFAFPQVAVDALGNAIAVWVQSDGTLNNRSIWANRFTAGSSSWGAATLIETENAGTDDAQVAVDASGNAIALWQQSDGTRYNIWANRFE